jgi:hypothetical protein
MCWEPRHPQDFVRGIKDNQAPALDRPRAAMPQYYLNLPTGPTNYASYPNDLTINFGNELDLRIKLSADNWSTIGTQVLIAKSSDVSFEFSLSIFSGAQIILTWMRQNGLTAAASSTAFPSFTNGVFYWIRSTLQMNVGGLRKINFYTSTDYNPDDRSGSWTQVGSEISAISINSIIPKTSSPLSIKYDAFGSPAADFIGKVYYAEVLSAINGPSVYIFDPSNTITSTKVSGANDIWQLYNSATMVEI